MTFNEDDVPEGMDLEAFASLNEAMVILRAAMAETCKGELPESLSERLGILFASIIRLTLSVSKERESGIAELGAPEDEVEAAFQSLMNYLIKCAVCYSIQFSKDAFSSHLPSFSSN